MANLTGSPNLRPFLRLRRGPVNQLRRVFGGGNRTFRDSALQHGQLLLSQVGQLTNELKDFEDKRPENYPKLTDKVQLVVEGDINSEELRKLDIHVIDEREGKKFVGVSEDQGLATLSERIASYMSQETEKGNPAYNSQIAPLETIRPARREDRIGIRLHRWIEEGRLNPNESELYDLEIAGGSTEEGGQNRQRFNSYLQEFQELFPSTELTASIHHLEELTITADSYSIHRARLPGAIVEDLLDNSKIEWLLLIDLIPQIEDDTFRLREVSASGVPPLPKLDQNAPRVVILDSGIAAGHPLFSETNNTIVDRQICFIPSWLDDTQDVADYVNRGHGTAVASIVAYGSISEFLLNQDPLFSPQFWVENAKILYSAARFGEAPPDDDRAKLHELQVPYWLMHEVVNEFHGTDPIHCRIFNLSIGSNPVRLDKVASSWSEAIDNLSAKNDILFVIAAGNLHLYEIADLNNKIGQYPQYLFSNEARLRDPAQAVNAITVGAFSESDLLPASARKRHRSLAPAKHPAPFSRTNLEESPIVKPDVIEGGGNLSIDSLTGTFNDRISTLAVPIANRNFLVGDPSGIIGYQCGTSIAAPKVSRLAGLIQLYNPEFSSNLIRALIINSAEWPRPDIFNQIPHPFGTENIDEIRRKKLQLCGYGIPQVEKALAANRNSIVLFAESDFEWNSEDDLTSGGRYASKVSFFRASFDPKDLNQPDILDEKVRVSVTLAYNPLVRKTNNNYQAVEMYWDLMRQGESVDNFEARLMKMSEDYEKITIKDDRSWILKPILNPGNVKRRGTVIKDWFETELCNVPSELEIAVSVSVNDWYLPPRPLLQPFALVISIESVAGRIPIYDRVRVRTRIPIQA